MRRLEDVNPDTENPTRISQAYFEIFEQLQDELFTDTDEMGDPALEEFRPEQLGTIIKTTIVELLKRGLIEDSAYIEQLGAMVMAREKTSE